MTAAAEAMDDAPSAAAARRPWMALALALGIALLITCVVSAQPLRAFHALLTGPLPQLRWSAESGWALHRVARFGLVIEDTITLTLLGLAVLFGLRARQFSMGADGQLFLSALAAAVVSVYAGGWPLLALPLAVAAAVATGFAWGWVPGVLKARYGANEIVTTLMLNAIALELYRLVITYAFNDPAAGFVAAPAVPESAALRPLLAQTHVTAWVALVPLAAAAAWLILNRSTLGYEIRLTGEAGAFAQQAGVPVARAVALSMALGGAFAGLAGVHLSNALLKRLPVDLAPGLGFEGLVVALLARNDPKAVPLAALLYAYLKSGAQAMERTADVPREMVLILQACIVLFVVSDRLLAGRRWLPWRRRSREESRP